jgi:hypothetical protein
MTDSDAIRADIERTRGELGDDVDALADKVRPSSIAHRQTDKIKSKFSSVRESVMGSVDDVREGGTAAVEKAKGNPVAVGLIAFGLGLLASSLIPASEKEKDLAGTVKEKAEPLTAAAGDLAKETAEHLKEPAQNAASEVKAAAEDAVDSVKVRAQG